MQLPCRRSGRRRRRGLAGHLFGRHVVAGLGRAQRQQQGVQLGNHLAHVCGQGRFDGDSWNGCDHPGWSAYSTTFGTMKK